MTKTTLTRIGRVLSIVAHRAPRVLTAKRMKVLTAVVSLVAVIISPSVAGYARNGSGEVVNEYVDY